MAIQVALNKYIDVSINKWGTCSYLGSIEDLEGIQIMKHLFGSNSPEI